MAANGQTLDVSGPGILHRLRLRCGRKRIVAPDGSAIVLSCKPQPDGTLVNALARAWRWTWAGSLRSEKQSGLASPTLVGFYA